MAAWVLFRFDPRRRDELGYPLGSDPHNPFGGMDLPVVDFAQHHAIRNAGRPTAGPLHNMVNLCPTWRAIAPGVSASAVADLHGSADRIGDRPVPPPDV